MIKGVYVRKLPNGKYRYFGLVGKGTGEMITLRAQATRRYMYAFEYDKAVGPGATHESQFFLYGGRLTPPKFQNANLLEVYRIKEIKTDGD